MKPMRIESMRALVDFSTAHETPIGMIVRNPNQPRKEFDPDEMKELETSMRDHGQKDTAIAEKLPDGVVRLVSGERRWRALSAIGAETMRLHFTKRLLTDDESYALACHGNAKQKEQSPYENILMVRQLLVQKLAKEEIASLVSRSMLWVEEYALLAQEIHPDVLEMMSWAHPKNERIDQNEALKIVRLATDMQRDAAQFVVATKKKGNDRIGQNMAFQMFREQRGAKTRGGHTATRTVNGELLAMLARFNRDAASFLAAPEGIFLANLRMSGKAFLEDLLAGIDGGEKPLKKLKRECMTFPWASLNELTNSAEVSRERLKELVTRALEQLSER